MHFELREFHLVRINIPGLGPDSEISAPVTEVGFCVYFPNWNGTKTSDICREPQDLLLVPNAKPETRETGAETMHAALNYWIFTKFQTCIRKLRELDPKLWIQP